MVRTAKKPPDGSYGLCVTRLIRWVAVGSTTVMAPIQSIQPIVVISDSIGHSRRLSRLRNSPSFLL